MCLFRFIVGTVQYASTTGSIMDTPVNLPTSSTGSLDQAIYSKKTTLCYHTPRADIRRSVSSSIRRAFGLVDCGPRIPLSHGYSNLPTLGTLEKFDRIVSSGRDGAEQLIRHSIRLLRVEVGNDLNDFARRHRA